MKSIKKSIFIFSVIIIIVFIIVSYFLFNRNKVIQDPSKKYNVIVIVSDALRRDVLGCYGGRTRTPNIDWLAANGTLFENAYSTAPTTIPSAISIFSGNYPKCYELSSPELVEQDFSDMKRSNRFRENTILLHVPHEEFQLSEAIQTLDYNVKCSIENRLAEITNNMQGYEKFKDYSIIKKEEINNIEKVTGIKPYAKCYLKMYGLLNFLINETDKKNFFIAKWFLDPHDPYFPIIKFRDKIKVDPSRLTSDIESYFHHSNIMKKGTFTDYDNYYLKERYKAEVESMDERIGYILNALKFKGLLEKTYIIFTSDHGEGFGEHNKWGHGDIYYEELVHMPLIIYGPKIKKKRIKTYVSNMSIMPTIKDLLCLSYKDDMRGVSLYRLLINDKDRDHEIYFNQSNSYTTRKRNSGRDYDGIIINKYKLIVKSRPRRTVFELYNLVRDPNEIENISAKNDEIIETMYTKILDIRKEIVKKSYVNESKVIKNIDLESKRKKLLEELKSLGYIK